MLICASDGFHKSFGEFLDKNNFELNDKVSSWEQLEKMDLSFDSTSQQSPAVTGSGYPTMYSNDSPPPPEPEEETEEYPF